MQWFYNSKIREMLFTWALDLDAFHGRYVLARASRYRADEITGAAVLSSYFICGLSLVDEAMSLSQSACDVSKLQQTCQDCPVFKYLAAFMEVDSSTILDSIISVFKMSMDSKTTLFDDVRFSLLHDRAC